MARVSPHTREFKGTVTLGSELLRRIVRAYLEDESQAITLTVQGNKVPGSPRFIGHISF